MTEKALEAMKAGGDLVRRGSRKKPHKAVKVAPASVIPEQNTETPVSPKNDLRKHPDQTLSRSIATMSFSGFTMDMICNALRLSESTVRQYYDHEFKTGQANMVSEIAGSLAQRALAGSDTAAIFLLKTRGAGKFTERNALELTGKDGGAIEIQQRTEILSTLNGILTKGITIDGEAEPLD